MSLPVVCPPLDSSFISIQFFVLNLDGWFDAYYLTNLLFFDIPLLYCYTNLNSSIICCLSSRDTYLFLVRPLDLLCLRPSKYICQLLFHHLVIFYSFFWNTHYFISNFITNQITSCFCGFLNCFFWCSFYCICCRFFSTIKKFSDHIYGLNVYTCF